MITPWIIAAVAVLCLICLLVYLIDRRRKDSFPYARRLSPLSDAENTFYHVLQSALPRGYVLLAQVPLTACFDAKTNDRTALNKIISKRFDYAVAHSERIGGIPTLILDLVIELDDSSHARADRRERDAFVNDVCKRTKLPLLRYENRRDGNYDRTLLREDLEKYL